MSRQIELLFTPPEGILGTLDPDHASNFVLDTNGVYVLDPRGNRIRLPVKSHGSCVLLQILNLTKQEDPGEEADLRRACRRALDVVRTLSTQEPTKIPRPFTKKQAMHLLRRTYLCHREVTSQSTEDVQAAKQYLLAYLGGVQSGGVQKLLVLWDVNKPLDAKVQDRRRQEDEISAELETAEDVYAETAVESHG